MKKKQTNYDKDFKRRAVLLSYEKGCIEEVENLLGITHSLLNKWRQDYKKYGSGSFPGSGYQRFTPEQKKINELEKRIAKAELGVKLIKNALPLLNQGRTALYVFIQDNEDCCSAKQICKILAIDQRCYSRWKKKRISTAQNQKLAVMQDIKAIFYENMKRYGYMRIAKELQNRGHSISTSTTARYMKELGLSVSIRKP